MLTTKLCYCLHAEHISARIGTPMKRRRRWLTLGVALLAGILGSAAPAQADIYLSNPIISVALGPTMPPEPFANRTTADSLASIIDALTATSSELHLQTTHVWVSGSTLEIDFDLSAEYNLSAFHFWNYHTESFDVDDVDLRFFDSSGTFLGTIENLSPALGNDTGMDSRAWPQRQSLPTTLTWNFHPTSATLTPYSPVQKMKSISITSAFLVSYPLFLAMSKATPPSTCSMSLRL